MSEPTKAPTVTVRRDALIPWRKLMDLALWLDLKFPNEGDEVQRDLRRMASEFYNVGVIDA